MPAPWGASLTRAVIEAIKHHRSDTEWVRADVAFAGERMDPALAEHAEEQLRELPGRDIRRLCDILAARAAMLRELS